MHGIRSVGRALAALVLVAIVTGRVAAQEPREEFTNLKVLPKDVAPDSLRALMNGFTRALGVRCIHCHVGQEGKPFQHGDFAKDDKPTKLKAREMMRMVTDLNGKYLANLQDRADPPIRVQCVTCHHGLPQPRTLQSVLDAAYASGGLDSALAKYHALHDRYYGSFAYDFGEVPLADVAGHVRTAGHWDDAERLLVLDVQENPRSAFAKRQHASLALERAFTAGADSGAATYRALQGAYGTTVVSEGLVNGAAYDLLFAGQTDPALAAFTFNTATNPGSSNAWDSMGEAYVKKGDRKHAIEAYQKSLALDPANDDAARQLQALGVKPKAPPRPATHAK